LNATDAQKEQVVGTGAIPARFVSDSLR
jgi:hypothetical protein